LDGILRENQAYSTVAPGLFKFADFKLDCSRYELRRGGHPLKLEKIPMELLQLLAESNGRLVSREEIEERLWGKDVFMDAERGINTAIRKIRQVLGDDPDNPRFVQTVQRKGYRFIAEVSSIPAPTPVPVEYRPSRRRTVLRIAAVAVLLLAWPACALAHCTFCAECAGDPLHRRAASYKSVSRFCG